MRLYRALLQLYPAAFRAEYASEMCSVFEQRRRDASGALAVVAWWFEVFFDVLCNAFAVQWDYLRQDLRYTARTLSRAPGFAITAVLVAGLGVGATTAVLTIADHVLIRPLPFADPDRLVKLWQTTPGYTRMELSPANYRDWKSMSQSFDAMASYRGLSTNLVGHGEPLRLEGTVVTAELFPMIGAQPALGRLFTAEDDREGAPGTLLLSHALWQGVFGGDPGVLGKRVRLDDGLYEVIGVMPRGFHFRSRKEELWTPMRFTAADFRDRGDNWLDVVAKLKRGVGIDQAREEMRVIAARLEQAYPKENARTGANVISLRDQLLSNQTRMLLGALLGAALCVLLIACANLANLLLARGLVRQKELAVRASLGAGRDRLVRQLVTESLVLALLGGALGIATANAAVPVLNRVVPTSLPIAEPSMDLRVLLFAVLLTVLTGLGFGVLPAIRACGRAGADGLREGSRGGVGGRRERLRAGLVMVEVAVSVVLLVSAGLLVRALWRLQAIDPGFRTEGVLTLRTSLPMPKYEKAAPREQFYAQVLEDVRELPGVSNAGYISFLPMTMRGGIWPVNIGGQTQNRAEGHTASLRMVTPGFFATMGIPLRAGRDVSESDTRESLSVAVVSESFVRRYWPRENPLGRRFGFGLSERTIVGVAGDIRVRGLVANSEPQVYLPYKQIPDGGLIWYAPKDLAIRTSMDAGALLPAVRRIIRSADPEQPISDVQTMAEIVEADTGPRRVQVRVLGVFAAVAFLLAGIGLHGLLSFTVAQRSQEIGVRMALGAQPGDILRMVLRESFVLAAAGVVLGGALGFAAGRWMEALLAGVKPGDAATFGSAAGLCLLMTALGSLLPAVRSVRVDPVSAIRAE
ncbi:MAG: ABC transporter permease [Bryobacteraceae bacterium]